MGMAEPKHKFRLKRSLELVLAGILGLSSSLVVADDLLPGLTISPHLGVSETYTDNLELAPAPYAVPAFVTQIMPGILINDVGPRTHFTVDYTLLDMVYDNYGWNHNYFNELNAAGSTEIVKNTFFVDAGASISQQPLTPFGPISPGGANLTNNIANVKMESVSPYLVHQFGVYATGEIRYTYVNTDYSMAGPGLSPGQPNNSVFGFSGQSYTTDVFLKSGDDFDLMPWKVEYNDATSLYTGYPSITMSTITGDISYLLTPHFKLNSEIGYEKDNYVYFGPRPQGVFWSEGFDWSPGPRTKFGFSVGEQYYGRTYSMSFSHRARHTIFSASYGQSVQTSMMQQNLPSSNALDQMLAAQIPDSGQRAQAIQQIFSAFGPQASLYGLNVISNEVFEAKYFQASVGLTVPRTVLMLTLFDNQNIPMQMSSAPGTPFSLVSNLFNQNGYLAYGEMHQTGVTLSWTRSITPEVMGNVSYTASQFNFPGISMNETSTFFQGGLTDQMTQHLYGSLSYRHQMMNAGAGGYNFAENAVIAGLTLRY
jgi:uncharacterized protein (PEP-CTERM system associated)